MTANLLLAALPLALALWLFVPQKAKTWGWWIGAGAFVAFLPNAPYVLTDLIHLDTDLNGAGSGLERVGLLVEYGLLVGVGLVFYGGCLYVVRQRLFADGLARWRWPAEIGLHAVCSVGIFIGRFLRLNSWDLVLRPSAVLQYVRVPQATTVVLIGVTFCVLLTVAAALRVPLAIHDLRRATR